jgi:glycosyltransferase involved in cell wall biosynthesis
MRVLIANTRIPFVDGGAEVLAQGLLAALRREGHDAEIVTIPFKWYPPERILDQMLAARLFDLSEAVGRKVDRLIGLKFPAYLAPHPNKTLWILHQHREAYDLWDKGAGDLHEYPNGRQVRDAIDRAERALLPEARRLYTISRNVTSRLANYLGLEGEPLYPPPPDAGVFYAREASDYLYFPSRVNGLKRQRLVIEAMALTRNPVRVCFSGAPDSPEFATSCLEAASHAGVAGRIVWRGRVSAEEMRELYARSRGVVFPPMDEDYGYVTLEAMLSRKPVITCSDSGGPLEFVLHRKTGLIAEPRPEALATAMDELWEEPGQAREWGEAGRDRYRDMNIEWPYAIERLLA